MKSAWVIAPKKVELKEIEMPKVTDDGILIKIKAAGVCGSDIGCFMCEHPFRTPPSMLGHEMSGVVVECGKNTTGFKPGDKVAFNPVVSCGHCELCEDGAGNCCADRTIAGADGSPIQGTFAEYINAPASFVTKFDDDISYDVGCLIEPMSVAVHAIKRFTGRKDSILVYGTGVIGICTVLLAKNMGYKRIYCTNRRKYNRDLAMEFGATAAWNPAETDTVEMLKKLEPNGVNAVMLSIADDKIIKECEDVLKPRGEIVYVYQNIKPVAVNFTPLVNREYAIYGATGETMEDFDEAAEYVSKHPDLCQKLISRVYPMTESAAAVDFMMQKEIPVIKVLVHPEEC